jgi:hypothetical protein
MSEVMEADKNCQGRVFPIALLGGARAGCKLRAGPIGDEAWANVNAERRASRSCGGASTGGAQKLMTRLRDGDVLRVLPFRRALPVIARSAPASSRSSWMERAFRFCISQAAFRGTNVFIASSFRYESYPGLLRNFAPRNDDPARSEAAGGRSQRWRNKGTLQAFFQASPKLACFAPSFSKQIFGGFVVFQ